MIQPHNINIILVLPYAEHDIRIYKYRIPINMTLKDFLNMNHVRQYIGHFSEFGVFSVPINSNYRLQEGDRIEGYRLLPSAKKILSKQPT